jgi:hypothetical protein
MRLKNKNQMVVTMLVLMILPAVMLGAAAHNTAYAKPKHNILTDLGNAADEGKAAGIAAFKAGLPDTCNGDIIYCHEFHAGYHEAQDVA